MLYDCAFMGRAANRDVRHGSGSCRRLDNRRVGKIGKVAHAAATPFSGARCCSPATQRRARRGEPAVEALVARKASSRAVHFLGSKVDSGGLPGRDLSIAPCFQAKYPQGSAGSPSTSSSGGASGAPTRARQSLALSLAIALLLLAVATFGLVRSSDGAPEPPASLDRLRVPPALMPPPLPRTTLSDRRIEVGGASESPIFGATWAPSRGFANPRRDEAASVIDERPSLISTDRKV